MFQRTDPSQRRGLAPSRWFSAVAQEFEVEEDTAADLATETERLSRGIGWIKAILTQATGRTVTDGSSEPGDRAMRRLVELRRATDEPRRPVVDSRPPGLSARRKARFAGWVGEAVSPRRCSMTTRW